MQPGAKRRLRAKATEVLDRLHERGVGDVLGVLTVPAQQARQAFEIHMPAPVFAELAAEAAGRLQHAMGSLSDA